MPGIASSSCSSKGEHRIPLSTSHLRANIDLSYRVLTTVRSHDKGAKVLKAHLVLRQSKLDYRIVEDVAKDGAFDEVSLRGQAAGSSDERYADWAPLSR